MEKDLSNYRMSYEKGALLKSNVPENPLELFQKWFHEVDNSDSIDEANAMTISTIGLDGYPKSRVVLLKKFTYEGLSFLLIMIVKREKQLLIMKMFVFLFLAFSRKTNNY